MRSTIYSHLLAAIECGKLPQSRERFFTSAQEKEIEADQLGDVFAARVGYDPTAYVGLLNRLKALKGDDRAFFKTHPNFSTRIAAVQKVMQSEGLKPTGVLLGDRFARLAKDS